MRKRQVSEIDLAAPIVALMKRKGCSVRQELPVTLNGQQVYADIVCRSVESSDEHWSICECKTDKLNDLLDQCRRWKGHVHRIWAGLPERKHTSKVMAAWLQLAASEGIGVIFVSEAGTCRSLAVDVPDFVDVTLIEHFFEKPGAAQDPPAGSGGAALRQVAKRSKWSAATDWLNRPENLGNTYPWKVIAPEVDMEDITPAAAAKAVKKKEWTGVKAVKELGQTRFQAKE